MIENLLAFWEEKRSTILLWGSVVVVMILAGVTVWLFLFNKGTLRVIADPPFTVRTAEAGDVFCENSPCDIELAVGIYDLEVLKSSYQNYREEVLIERGKVSEKNVELVFIPEVTVDENRWDFELREMFSQQFQNISLFDPLPDAEKLGLLIKNFTDDFYLWAPKAKRFFFVVKDEENSNSTLFSQAEVRGERKRITFFPRDIESGFLSINKMETLIAVIEISGDEGQIYVVDLTTKSKRRVGKINGIQKVGWLRSDDLIVEYVSNGAVSLSLIDIESGGIIDLPFAADFENITSRKDGRILFVAGRVDDLVSQNEENTGNAPESGVFLNEFNPVDQEISILVNVQNSLRSFPEAIELSEAEDVVRVLSSGLLFDVKLEK